MRELLLAFIIALIVGSIINGMQQKPTATDNSRNPASASAPDGTSQISGNQDFPDFGLIVSLDSTNFKDLVLDNKMPVLIFCYAPGSQACEQMIPLFSAVAKKHAESISIAKLNVLDNAQLAHHYQIDTVPAFLFFKEGNLVNQVEGVVPEERLEMLTSGY